MTEYHVRVFADRSELVLPTGQETIFLEGPNNAATKKRYKEITTALEGGYLREQIRLCREEPEKLLSNTLSEADQQLFDDFVASITSEVGRALIGLAVLQLTIEDQFLEAAVQIMDRYVDRGVQRGWGGLFSGGGQQ